MDVFSLSNFECFGPPLQLSHERDAPPPCVSDRPSPLLDAKVVGRTFTTPLLSSLRKWALGCCSFHHMPMPSRQAQRKAERHAAKAHEHDYGYYHGSGRGWQIAGGGRRGFPPYTEKIPVAHVFTVDKVM